MRLTRNLLIYLLLGLGLVGSYWLHSHIFLRTDVGWHIAGAQRFLAGGHYVINIFDDNPPMVFWLFIPIVWLQPYIGVSLLNTCLIYVSCIILISALCTYHVLNRTPFISPWHSFWLMVALLVTYLFLPNYEYATREALLCVLLIPYIVLRGVQYQFFHLPGNYYLRILIGLMAGIGLALNTLYLVVVLAIELTLRINAHQKQQPQHNAAGIALVLMLLGYFSLTLLLTPDYYLLILPKVWHYMSGYDTSKSLLITNLETWLTFLAIAIYLLTWLANQSTPLSSTLLVGVIMSLAIYIFEGRNWYYHILPATSLAFLLVTNNLITLLLEPSPSKAASRPRGLIYLALAFIIIYMSNQARSYVVEWHYYQDPQAKLNQLITFAKDHLAQRKVIFFSTTLLAYPLTLYAAIDNVSPWSDCWFIPKLAREAALVHTGNQATKTHFNADKAFFTNMIISTFITQQPEVIVVDIDRYKSYLGTLNFNYFDFFGADPRFKQILSQYHFITQVKDSSTTYGVYEKK